jgi:hypothetical protein
VDSNLSTQAQLGGRARHSDLRFQALNRPPRATEALERDGYETTVAGLGELIEENEGTKLADKALVAKFAMTHLYKNGLKPKLGGSLAVRLRGGEKEPKDVDIELPSAGQLEDAHERLTGKFKFRGESLTVRTCEDEFQAGVGVLLDVKLERSSVRTNSARVGIDLINENTPSFNREIAAPERTGSPAVGTSDPFRLVVNAVDRRMNKPAMSVSKQDAKTIYHLLKDMGYHPSDSSHRRAIKDQIASKLADPRDASDYMRVLEKMLNEYYDERKGRSSKNSKGDNSCSVM